MEWTRFSSEKFQRGIIPSKMLVELRFFFSAHRLMIICICTKFHENILDDIKVIERRSVTESGEQENDYHTP